MEKMNNQEELRKIIHIQWINSFNSIFARYVGASNATIKESIRMLVTERVYKLQNSKAIGITHINIIYDALLTFKSEEELNQYAPKALINYVCSAYIEATIEDALRDYGFEIAQQEDVAQQEESKLVDNAKEIPVNEVTESIKSNAIPNIKKEHVGVIVEHLEALGCGDIETVLKNPSHKDYPHELLDKLIAFDHNLNDRHKIMRFPN